MLYDVTLNGVPLSTVSPSIFVVDITETPADSVTTQPKPLHNGSRRIRQQRESLIVTVSYALREQSVERRLEIMQLVQKWAQKGGFLTRSDRPGQRLRVVCDTPPRIDSALKWTEVLQLSFTAYDEPFWESLSPVSCTTTGKKQLFVPGTAQDVRASATVTVTGSTLTSLTVATGCGSIKLAGMSIQQNGVIDIGYTDDGYLYIRSGDASLMLDRTIDSSDELRVPVGYSDVQVSGNTGVSMILTARGAWY